MNNIVGRFIGAWLHPWAAMNAVKEEGEDAGIVPAMIFVVVMGLVSGLITSVVGTIIPPATLPPGSSKAAIWMAVLIVPLISFLGSFVGALIIWGLVDGLVRGTSPQYKTSYRLLALLAAFSPVSAALAAVPKAGQYLALAVNIWATVVMIQGIVIVRDTRPLRTWITCGIIFSLLFAFGIFARVAAQRQLQGGLPAFGDLGQEDLGMESDQLSKELEGLADKAKQDKAKEPAPPTK